MVQVIPDVKNPYWDDVRPYLFTDHRPWGSEQSIDLMRLSTGEYRKLDTEEAKEALGKYNRHSMVKKYSWTIPDPATLAFVAEHCQGQGKVLDPLAGTGYWSYLLNQLGIEIFASDKFLPEENQYHKDQEMWMPVFQHDALDALKVYEPQVLLLSWVPYSSELGTEIVKAFQGSRIVYIGEHEGGCCGDDSLFEELGKWEEVKSHRPIQWWGMHDYVTVYDRKAIGS